MSQAPATQNTQAAPALTAPDRGLGLFETILILDGEAVELGVHLERLAKSLRELFDSELPAGLATDVAERARGLILGRMRIDVDPAGAGAALKAQTVDPADHFPTWERGATLRSVFSDGGLGRHKWADRRPLGEAAGAPVPLLFDRGEEVLEAGRANVFAVVDQVLVTPAADGRILPGTARAATIQIARGEGIEVRERHLDREQLLAADEVFLTGSVRGVEPARSLDEEELPDTGRLSRQLAAGLRHRWHRQLRSPPATSRP
jgi:para-aminobenzoate synthetase/4-amino-4-deoxychorismate lyase